jgi:hypothetical protein
VEEFIPPEGIVAVPIDPETLAVAVPECPLVRTEKFLVGTEPRDLCPRHRPSGLRRVTRTLLRAIGLGQEARRAAEPQPAPRAAQPAPPKQITEEDEYIEEEMVVELPPKEPEGKGMMRRAASTIAAVPQRVVKVVKKKKKEEKREPQRE